MQLLDSEQIEIADEYFRFRAINPPCAGNCVSVRSGGRTAACPVPRSAEASVRQLPALYPQAHTCAHWPRAPHRVGVQRVAGLWPKPADTGRRFWRKSGGEAEYSQEKERKWEGSWVQGNVSHELGRRRDGVYCQLRFLKQMKPKWVVKRITLIQTA